MNHKDTSLWATPIPLAKLPEKPLVSVLMSSYNYAEYVAEAIESVLSQTYKNFELIICDDGSTDDSRAIATRYAHVDSRIRLIEKTNGGQASAWNAAFCQSRGEVICFLDADDTFLEQKLEIVVSQFQANSNAGFLSHSINLVDINGHFVQRSPMPSSMSKLGKGWIAEEVIQSGGEWRSNPSTALSCRREVATLIFPIPEEPFRGHADIFVFMLAPLLTPVDSCESALSTYRIHGQNMAAAFRFNAHLTYEVAIRKQNAIAQINQRLADIGLVRTRLDWKKNSACVWGPCMQKIAAGESRSALYNDTCRLIRFILFQDRHSVLQRLYTVFVLAVTYALPIPLRSQWLDLTFGTNRTKRSIQRALYRATRATWPGRSRGVMES